MAKTGRLCKAKRDAWWTSKPADAIVKPWGYEQPLTSPTAKPTLKLLCINGYEETSMHYHVKKSEVFIVLHGKVIVILGKRVIDRAVFDERTIHLSRYDTLHIPPNIPHRIRAVGIDNTATILEVADMLTGDVHRVENHWGRGDEP